MKNRIFSVLLIATMLLCTACGASGAATDNYIANGRGDYSKAESEYFYSTSTSADAGMMVSPSSPAESGKPVDTTAPNDALADRKIVRTMRLSAETKAFDDATAAIERLCSELGGYIENSSRSGSSMYNSSVVARSANYTLRIPADKLDAFRSSVGQSINITNESSDIDDITDTYFDVDTRLATLRVEEERLLAMLEKATELEYLITLEKRLTEVRYEIESYTSTLRRYDNRVAYSTVHLNLDEVVEYTERIEAPKSFGEQISIAFHESWSDFASGCRAFAVELVYALPTLLVIAVIGGGGLTVLIVSLTRASRRNRARAEQRAAARAAEAQKESDT